MEKRYSVPVSFESRERCSLMSERIWGAAREAENAIWVEVRDGIGLAVLSQGRLLSGSRGLAGEVGHMRMAKDGDLCMCGGRGCLETLSSERAILDRVRSAIDQGIQSDLLDPRPERLTISNVVAAGLGGDRLAYNVLTNAFYHLGVAVGNLLNLFNPDTVILEGDVFGRAARACWTCCAGRPRPWLWPRCGGTSAGTSPRWRTPSPGAQPPWR